MSHAKFWKELERRTEKYHLLNHPFYKAWAAGELTRDDLREYARDYYHHVASFPEYLEALAGRLPDGELRTAVLENRADELGMDAAGGRPHHVIWLDFARAMGAEPIEVETSRPIPEVQDLIDTFDTVARTGRPAEVLGAFYAYESQVPEIAVEKARGLREHYGAGEAACEYFTLHATADVYHSQVWHDQLERLISTHPDQEQPALEAAEKAAHALWHALDGIEARRHATVAS